MNTLDLPVTDTWTQSKYLERLQRIGRKIDVEIWFKFFNG